MNETGSTPQDTDTTTRRAMLLGGAMLALVLLVFGLGKLGILPSGTGCDFARGLGVGPGFERALEQLVEGEARVIDVNRAVRNNPVFVFAPQLLLLSDPAPAHTLHNAAQQLLPGI